MYTKFVKWIESHNYFGETFPEYYIAFSWSDADETLMDRSNAEYVMKTYPQAKWHHAKFGGYMGAFDSLLIHESETALLEELEAKLISYPALDEDDYNERYDELLEGQWSGWGRDHTIVQIQTLFLSYLDEESENEKGEILESDKLKALIEYCHYEWRINDGYLTNAQIKKLVQEWEKIHSDALKVSIT